MTELVEIERRGTTLTATDVANNVVSFDVTGWESSVEAATFDEPIDAMAAGRVSSVRYDIENWARIDRLDGDLDVTGDTPTYADMHIGYEDSVAYELPEGEYRCKIDANLFITIHIDGAVELTKRPYAPLVFSFPHPTPVTFAFRTMVDYPSHELTVEPTVDGVATALSHLPAAMTTTTPDRVHRDYRGYPPRITIGEETEIPATVRRATPDTGIELLVPDSLESVFAAASLAYFTGATLRPGDVPAPRLRADAVGLEYEFSSLTREAPAWLRRTFFLELLASWHGPDSITLTEHEQLAEAGITFEDCVDAPLAERLETYFGFPTEPLDEIFPPWPYWMTVDPRPELAPVLPHLLHDLAAVTLPGDALRTRDGTATDPASTLNATRDLRGGVGESCQESDFTAPPVAYEHRLRYFDGGSGTLQVCVVVADEDEREFGEALRQRYTQRTDVRSLLSDLLVAPTREELAATLEQGAQLVHYVGNCRDGALACQDGPLDLTAVTANNVELFVLDAPGGESVADDIVSTGSVACAVRSPADEGASRVDASAMLGELLLYGQSFGSAAASSTALGGVSADVIVGDATHRFIPRWNPSPVTLLADTDEGIDVTIVPFPVDPVGAYWFPELDSGKQLLSAAFELTIQQEDISRLVANGQGPLYYDGRLYWDDDQKQLVYPIA